MIVFNQIIHSTFSAFGNPIIAEQMSKYMRNQFSFFGLPTPYRRHLTRILVKKIDRTSIPDLTEIIKEQWQQPQREFQYYALDLIEQNQERFDDNLIELIENFIVEKSWWDTIDVLAGKLAASFFKKYPHKMEEISSRWNESENIWLNRSSIIFQLSYKNETNTNLLSKFILNHAQSDEFFLQKSIGWALREYSKSDKDFVINFIKNNELKPLSKREALKYINKKSVH